ncbi:uncharacterized protein LOC119694745 isoform X1 [Plutella xylostella]|uniref:uncharacterized protein LOC119694745 isoform X1 n=1 Tax=Plutella xylostella TaxID=51655 RepID=UPI00203239D8|nr:uncharacterized protein LOC119694745 isoform X1 [Plutella xylostella]
MQDSDLDQGRRVGVDEKYIHFRPSPNFKKMKKFLKSKIDENSVQAGECPCAATEGMEGAGGGAPPPPLPLGPPPPDSPGHEPAADTHDEFNEEILNNIKKEKDDGEKQVKTGDVCRNFIRGNCTRGAGTCRFAHKHDLALLKKITNFCRDYQNSICKHKNCRFVHASIFEQEKFYRTGVLPPHATAHVRNNAAGSLASPPAARPAVRLMPPPPPPQPAPLPAPAVNLANPPPIVPISMGLVKQGTPPPPPGSAGAPAAKPGLGDHAALINKFDMASLNLNNGVKASSCPNCDVLKNRLLHTQSKAATINNSIKNMNHELEDLEKKERRLDAVIIYLLKQNERTGRRPQIGN